MLKEARAFLLGGSGLRNQRLAERVVAVDEPVVPQVQALKVLDVWDEVELAAWATVALCAGQNEVPDTVDIHATKRLGLVEPLGEEVVDIGVQRFTTADGDWLIAIETCAFLIPVESIAHSDD